jgi:small subunit ribosomal protein S7e
LRSFQKIQSRLVREIEKKFSEKHVVIIASRKIISKDARQKQKRPRSRTMTAVHENMLNDIVYPAEIVGKRTRVNVDGSKLIKIHLDTKDQSTMEHKLDTFIAVYKKLTGKDTTFLFAVQAEN